MVMVSADHGKLVESADTTTVTTFVTQLWYWLSMMNEWDHLVSQV